MDVVPPRTWRPESFPISEFIASFKNYQKTPGRCSRIRLIDEGRNCVTIGWDRPKDLGSSVEVVYKVEILDESGEWKELGLSMRSQLEVFGLKGKKKIKVTAGNSHGWGEPSEEESLDIPENYLRLPNFSLELPSHKNIKPKEKIVLECKAEGYPPPELSWYKNGEDLGVKGNELTLDCLKDGGLYVCEARNCFGKISTHCYINLVKPGNPPLEEYRIRLLPREGEYGPDIKFPLRDREVDLGETVRLTLEVVGEPKPIVEWLKDGEPLLTENYQKSSDGSFHTLEIVATQEAEGLYTARASGLGTAVTSAAISIKPHSSCHFTLPLEPFTRVKLGGNIRLIATLAPHLRLAKVIWSRDGVNLVPSRNCVMTHSAGGEVTLELAYISMRDGGLYACSVLGQGGLCAESTCELEVIDSVPPPTPAPCAPIPYSNKPVFVMKPRNVEALEGDTIILHCEVVGDPNPTVHWLRDDLKVSRYSRDQGEFRESRSGSTCSLEIRHVKLSYTGKYTAVASNSHGNAIAVSTLQVFARGQGGKLKWSGGRLIDSECDTLPLISRPLSDSRVTLGEPLYLECRVKGEPEPTVIWYKDGKLVKRGKNRFEGETATLEIREPCLADEGSYTCCATNSLGTASTSAYIWVTDPLSTVTDPPKSVSPCVTRCGPKADPEDPFKNRHRRPCSPRFLSVPHSKVVYGGEAVRLICAVSGWPEPNAQWLFEGQPVSPSLNVLEEGDRRSLTIPAAKKEHSGLYTVVCTNPHGTTRASASLQVMNEYK